MKLLFLFRFLSSWLRNIRSACFNSPICLFLTARFSSLLQSRLLPPELLALPCTITSAFHFYFSKSPQMFPPGPHFSTRKPLAFPGCTWKPRFLSPGYFFFFFFFFLPSATLSLAAPLNRTRSVAAMCATPTSYLTVLFLDPLSRPGSRAALIKSLSASPISKM